MKSNKSLNYVSKFKYLMLIPIILVLASILVGVIFNLNLDYDFRRVSNFTVKFNTTISETEYDNFEDSLKEIIKDYDFNDFRLERIGSGAQNGIFVRIPDEDAKYEDKIADLKVYIEENLLTETDAIESSVVVSTTDTGFSLSKNVVKMIWLSILAVACIAVFMFFYNWIRYNLMAGCSIALSIALSVVMLLAGMITFRIPFNYYFVLPFIVMVLSLVLNTTIMNNRIKSELALDTKVTNADRVQETTAKTFKGIVTYNSMLALAIMVVMFFGGASLIYLGLAIVVGLIVSVFVSLFIYTSLWSFWYKKDKDKVLKRRIQAEQKREEDKKSGKKSDDKIVV